MNRGDTDGCPSTDPGGDVIEELARFGSDWLYILVPGVGMLAVLAQLLRRTQIPRSAPTIAHLGSGAAYVSGLPSWVAAPLAILLLGVFPFAVIGFWWDVAWHIDTGRDEFLLSPPHIALLLGVSLIGVAGLVGVALATRDRADVRWRVRGQRVPYGAGAMLVAGTAAVAGWSIDELWHRAYGLDVTMWSPPHLLMIASAAFVPLAGWLLLAEAGRGAGHRWTHRYLRPFLAAAVLIGLSAFQLEFDLGVPQWQHLFQPVLIALTAGLGLTAARAALGRGGALLAAGGFIAVRALTFAITTGPWGLSQPRFPLYLAAALAVEAVFAVVPARRPLLTALAAGVGVGTVGLAGEWLWGQLAFHHPWSSGLLPGIAIASVLAVAMAVLGTAFGRIVRHRAPGIGAVPVGAAIGVALVCLALPLPRTTPDGEATVATAPAGDDLVEVTVSVDPPQAISRPERFEVMAWQGGGRVLAPLVATGVPGEYGTEQPVPVAGAWKTMVRLAARDHLGAVPIRLPADPEIGASAVSLAAERSGPFLAEPTVLLREAREGPTWPAVVAYGTLGLTTAAIIVVLVAGSAGLQQRTRRLGEDGDAGPLEARPEEARRQEPVA